MIWQCNGEYKGEKKCNTPHLNETDIKAAYLKALNRLISESESLTDDCCFMVEVLSDTSEIDAECKTLAEETDTLTVLIERLIAENSSRAMNQDEYRERYGKYEKQFETAQKHYAELQRQKRSRLAEVEEIKRFAELLRLKEGIPLDFDENLWNAIVDHVTVSADGTLTFVFKNGKEIKERI